MNEKNVSQPKPLIIWTLQRTGGTNMARRLFEAIGRAAPEHEPFNLGRVYGPITEKWKSGGDVGSLEMSCEEITKRGESIKHCVEMVPLEVTAALAKASAQAGYVHLFLYRRNPLGRLLSLQFAKLSGIWGPGLKDKAELNEKIFAEPLPVQQLSRHEMRSVNALNRAWSALCDAGASPLAIAYEDVYQDRNPELPITELMPVIQALGLSRSPAEDRSFIETLISGGDQGTRDKYGAFKGIDELEKALGAVPRFSPQRRMCGLKAIRVDHPWVLHADVDAAHSVLELGLVQPVGGVVVLSPEAPEGVRLQLFAGGRDIPVSWNIASPWMGKKYPAAPNAKKSRFSVTLPADLESGLWQLRIIMGEQAVPVLSIEVAPAKAG